MADAPLFEDLDEIGKEAAKLVAEAQDAEAKAAAAHSAAEQAVFQIINKAQESISTLYAYLKPGQPSPLVAVLWPGSQPADVPAGAVPVSVPVSAFDPIPVEPAPVEPAPVVLEPTPQPPAPDPVFIVDEPQVEDVILPVEQPPAPPAPPVEPAPVEVVAAEPELPVGESELPVGEPELPVGEPELPFAEVVETPVAEAQPEPQPEVVAAPVADVAPQPDPVFIIDEPQPDVVAPVEPVGGEVAPQEPAFPTEAVVTVPADVAPVTVEPGADVTVDPQPQETEQDEESVQNGVIING